VENLLPQQALLIAFLSASLLLALTPGPGVMYIVARSLAHGRRAGLASVAGVAAGNLLNAVGAAVGLATLLTLSSTLFLVVKYLGAAYLVYLGIRALRAAAAPTGPQAPPARAHLLRDGLWVALLNPKTTLFYAAFLPQFMSPGGDPLLQGILLGVVFVAIAAATDALYAVAAGTIGPRLHGRRGPPRLGRYVSGMTFIGLGLFAAFSGHGPRQPTPRV
jgi:threonine/homoserine/homoserine lactone efflux protein